MLTPIDRDLWTAEAPLRFAGLEVGTRMTIVRLSDGRLLLHSPVAASEALVREVEALGPVAFVVAPNRLHHLFAAEWTRACPEAALYVAPGLAEKRPDLVVAGVLGDEPEPSWADVLDQLVLRGIPFTNEVVFFHRPSATLLLTDLAFNVGAESPPLTRLVFRLAGTFERLSPTFLERLLVRDRAAFRDAFERMLAWPFERVIVTHGAIEEQGGREALKRGYGWLFDAPGRLPWQLLWIALVALFVYVGLRPAAAPPAPGHADLVAHAVINLVLGLVAYRAFAFPRAFAVALGVLFAVGAAIEGLQAFSPNREPSLADLLADGLGIALAWGVGWLWARR